LCWQRSILLVNHSHQLADMLTYCHFKQELVACSDIFTPKMTEYGICYTFNDGGEKRIEAVGEGAGVIYLFVVTQKFKFLFYNKEAMDQVIIRKQ
jgi:hypothetical protein